MFSLIRHHVSTILAKNITKNLPKSMSIVFSRNDRSVGYSAFLGLLLWSTILGGSLWTGQAANSQESIVFPPPIDKATAEKRSSHLAQVALNITPDRYDLDRYPLTSKNEAHWRSTLWASAVLEPDHPEIASALVNLLSLTLKPRLTDTETRLLEMALQVSHQFYDRSEQWQQRLKPALEETIARSNHPRWVTLALSTLVQTHRIEDVSEDLRNDRENWLNTAKIRLESLEKLAPDPKSSLLLNIAIRDLSDRLFGNPLDVAQPPIEDWFSWQISPGELQLFVLCDQTRSQPCHTALKNGSGQWVTDPQDATQIWSIALSGRSLHGLPWYLSRGETPQGIYRLDRFIAQPDTDFFYAYGFFPLLNLYVPKEEAIPSLSFPHKIQQLSDYQQLLPPRWRNYFPAQETYWAGSLGRGLFRIHGTGESTDFFANNDRYPASQGWNPAIGCLTALEQYDAQGNLVRGDMANLLQILESLTVEKTTETIANPPGIIGQTTGYVIVLNVPDPPQLIQSLRARPLN